MVHTGTITLKDKSLGLQKNLKKKCRSQKSLVWMMMRLNRTGAKPNPGNQEVVAEVSLRNGSSRNGLMIFTASDTSILGMIPSKSENTS
jgi:hypothetical protein